MPLSKVKIRMGYLIALMLMLFSYGLIFFVIRKLARENDEVTKAHIVTQKLSDMVSEVSSAEAGVRGYILTNDYRYLKPYNTAKTNIPILNDQLDAMLPNEVIDNSKLELLNSLTTRRLTSLAEAIRIFQMEGFQVTKAVMAPSSPNMLLTDSIRNMLLELQDKQQLQIKRRESDLQRFYNNTTIVTLLSLMVALITVVASIYVYNRENKAKERAISNARNYGQQLEDRVKELDKVNLELEELKSIEKFAATGRIARTIAHEVRNPLTNIGLASEQIKDLAINDPEAETLLSMIDRNVNRINQLVSDLLHSTRFAQLEYSHASLHKLLDETLELASDRIELRDIQMTTDYAKDLGDVFVDAEKIKIAFLNIIVNALEAVENGKGIVEVKTRKAGNRCVIDISDNGSGMDTETLSRLFEPYFTQKKKGNGLGLTNTQNIILNHKGSIMVRSAPGEGTNFTITLPLSTN